MYSTLLLVVFCTTSVQSTPVDYPIMIDLPVYESPESPNDQRSQVYLSGPLLAENPPGVDSTDKDNLEFNLITDVTSKTISYDNLPEIVTGNNDGVVLEKESLDSQILSKKENIQNFAAGLLQPKPIVDTIREEEKYGNTGDKFYSAGRALVGGAESISNLVNSLIAVPGTIIQSITRAASEKLNALGGKIVGL